MKTLTKYLRKNIMSEQIKSNNNMTGSLKPKLPQISYQDLIKFKEELLKELRDYKYQTTLNINNEFHKYEKLIENKNVITDFIEKEKLSLLSKSEFSIEKNNILSQISNKEQEIQNKLVVTEVQLNSYKRDVEKSIYRYDKIIVENLQIPGLVGNACKYPNLKEYILANKEELNNSSMISKQASMELKSFKKKTEMNISIINEKISDQKYKLLNLINSKFNEVNEKFEGLYTALSEKINNMDNVNNENENLNQEIKKLNDLIFENKNKIIEENNISKGELLTEIDEIKKKFEKTNKNIINLANLLMGKNNKQNKKAIIDNFNDMNMDLFKDINIDNINLEKNNENHFNKNNNDNITSSRRLKKKHTFKELDKNIIKPCAKSSVKSYIEGKISANDTKFNSGNQRRSSVQINNFSLLKFQSQINKNNSSSNDVPKVHQTRKLNKRYSQIIINKSDLNQNSKNKKKKEKIKRGKSLNCKQKEEKENYSHSKINESFNNNIHLNDKNMNDDDEIINEEDSNKFSSSENSSNTQKLDKRHSLNSIDFKNSKDNHKHNHKNNESKKNNDFDSSEMSSSTKKIENSLDSSKFIYNNENNENENQGKSNKNNITPLNMDNLNQNFNEKLNNIRSINNYTLYEAITKNLLTNINCKQDLDEKKIENEKTDLTETNINNKLNKSINNNNVLNQKDLNTNENINNNSIKLNQNKNNNQLIIKEKINVKPKLLFEKKANQHSKIKLKKNIDIKYLKENINDNYLTLNNIKKRNDIIDRTPKINKTIKGNLRTMSIQNNSNSKLNEKNILSPTRYFNSTLYKNNIMIKTTRNTNINTIMNSITEKGKYFSSFDLQKNNINKNRNIDNIKKGLSEKKNDGLKLNLNYINKDKDDKDIYIDKEVFKNVRFIKDEEIIDRPLLFDRNTFKIDKNKGLLENKILELEFFTKKKFDELVNEIKHFIPIHFNSHLKNYSIIKK